MKPETQEQISDLLLWNDETTYQLMQEIATKHGVHLDALADLVAWERKQQIHSTNRGITRAFDEVFENKEYWR